MIRKMQMRFHRNRLHLVLGLFHLNRFLVKPFQLQSQRTLSRMLHSMRQMDSVTTVRQIRILYITVQLNLQQLTYMNRTGTRQQPWRILELIYCRVRFLQPMVMVPIQSMYMTVMQFLYLLEVHIRGHLILMEVFSNSIQI